MEGPTANINDLLGVESRDVPVRVLRRPARNIISTLLNPIKIFNSEEGIPRDWQGLAELCGISGEAIPSLQNDSDPCSKVLDLWYEQDRKQCTINNFITFLERMERYDIIDDITPLIEEDINYYFHNKDTNRKNLSDRDDMILTVDDMLRIPEGLDPQTYDAFVLFADDDIDFATELIEKMEKEYDLKLFVKFRDLVGGAPEHYAMSRLISERCNKFIVILSPSLMESPEFKFFYNFAHTVAIEQRQKKVLPCMYKPIGKLPPELLGLFILDYERTYKVRQNFWLILYRTIKMSDGKSIAQGSINSSRISSNNSCSQQCLPSPVLEQQTNNSIDETQLGQNKCKSMLELHSTDKEQITIVPAIPNESISESHLNNLVTDTVTETVTTNFYKRFKVKFTKSKNKNGEIKPATEEITDRKVEEKKKKGIFGKTKKKKVPVAN